MVLYICLIGFSSGCNWPWRLIYFSLIFSVYYICNTSLYWQCPYLPVATHGHLPSYLKKIAIGNRKREYLRYEEWIICWRCSYVLQQPAGQGKIMGIGGVIAFLETWSSLSVAVSLGNRIFHFYRLFDPFSCTYL